MMFNTLAAETQEERDSSKLSPYKEVNRKISDEYALTQSRRILHENLQHSLDVENSEKGNFDRKSSTRMMSKFKLGSFASNNTIEMESNEDEDEDDLYKQGS